MLKKTDFRRQQHPFHLVTPSPWPIATSFSILALASNFVTYLHYSRVSGFYQMSCAMLLVLFCLYRWFSDVITEATFEGNHTLKVRRGLRYGMFLFIVSEAMFFFSFFWAFFHSSLNPSIYIGAVWPPYGLEVLDPWGLPLLNTLILLYSGISVTWAHRCIKAGLYNKTTISLTITIFAGLLFTALQLKEYIEAPFSINDSIYGSIFYIATGFHGFHAIIGTIFLIVCLLRHLNYHFTREHHLGFEAASWYWHFVDIIWIFLWLTIYLWGSNWGGNNIVLDYEQQLPFLLDLESEQREKFQDMMETEIAKVYKANLPQNAGNLIHWNLEKSDFLDINSYL